VVKGIGRSSEVRFKSRLAIYSIRYFNGGRGVAEPVQDGKGGIREKVTRQHGWEREADIAKVMMVDEKH
jgi:hypothetical protein